MEIEFNLSNNIIIAPNGISELILKKDVKEFIKILKERVSQETLDFDELPRLLEDIDKLAGDKLI